MATGSFKTALKRIPPTVAALIFAVIVLAVAGYYIAQRQEPTVNPNEAVDPNDPDALALGKRVDYALPVARVVDGIAEDTGADLLEFPAIAGEIWLNLPVVFTVRIDGTYNLFINDFGGEQLYEVWIPPQYLEKGEIPLRLDGNIFGPGQYHIEIIEETADSVSTLVAEASFRITE